jgi:YD repeat-containing protein
LTKTILADGNWLRYAYDGAHRLIEVADNLDNAIQYTLDAMGNRIGESVFDSADVLVKTRTRVYDGLNRLAQDIGGSDPQQQITAYGYDNNNNRLSTLDPLGRTTTQEYDALNRLLAITDPLNGAAAKTRYSYDARDRLGEKWGKRGQGRIVFRIGFGFQENQCEPDNHLAGLLVVSR